MHHFKAKGGTVFNFNSDLSGEVIMRLPEERGVALNITAPAADLLEFAEHVREQYPQNASDADDAQAAVLQTAAALTLDDIRALEWRLDGSENEAIAALLRALRMWRA